jgi:hypothetical protein
LAVNANVHQRMQRVSPLCPVCCTEEESAHHSMVRCTLARALRDGMRTVWALPEEKCFRLTGRTGSFCFSMASTSRQGQSCCSSCGGPGTIATTSSTGTGKHPWLPRCPSCRTMLSLSVRVPRSRIVKAKGLLSRCVRWTSRKNLLVQLQAGCPHPWDG